MGQPFYEDVHVDDKLPEHVETVDRTRLFFFSAATYNGHRIHYDPLWARDTEGLDDILVHGPLQAAIAAAWLRGWAGRLGRLDRIRFEHRGSAFPDSPLHFAGAVTARRRAGVDALVDISFAERAEDGRLLMPGTATLALPTRSS